ncbi:unnamed protein product, partial [Ectocarpus sp. 4 AP-2014]
GKEFCLLRRLGSSCRIGDRQRWGIVGGSDRKASIAAEGRRGFTASGSRGREGKEGWLVRSAATPDGRRRGGRRRGPRACGRDMRDLHGTVPGKRCARGSALPAPVPSK